MLQPRVRKLLTRFLRLAARVNPAASAKSGLRLELAKEYRGRALLYLALAEGWNLRLTDRDAYSLQYDLSLTDYWDLISKSAAARPQPTVVRDSEPGEGAWGVSYDYFERELRREELAVPYTLHPYYYASGVYRTLPENRRHRRNIGVFFAGSTGISAYDTEFKFPLMNRLRVMQSALDAHRSSIFYISTEDDYRKALEMELPFVASVTQKDGDNLEKHRLNPSQYMDLLSRSRFALCPPGVRMPQSHNLIEALSVGTVPILEYAAWCRPALTADDNCLVFDSAEKLRSVLDRALKMDPAEVRSFSTRAAAYYDASCSVAGFAKTLVDAARNDQRLNLVVLDETASVEAWLSKRSANQPVSAP